MTAYITNTYLPSVVEFSLHQPDEKVKGLAFISNPSGVKYIELSIEQKINHILTGIGKSGSCYDYLANTIEHLAQLDIKDKPLSDLYRKINTYKAVDC